MTTPQKTFWLLFFPVFAGCIDPIEFDVASNVSQLVVEGSITNEPGPYVVTLFRTRALQTDMDYRLPVEGATVTILSDAGEEEALIRKAPGIFVTTDIRGVIGRSYFIRITTNEGAIYESVPEIIKSPGIIESLWYEFEARRKPLNTIDINDDRLNVYLNSTTQPEQENYIRWRVLGTYQIETQPWLRTKQNPDGPGLIPDPHPCSGYENRANLLVEVKDCTCCTCWVTNYEPLPQVSDEQFNEDNRFRRKLVGIVPLKPDYFVRGYHVAVSQMSVSKAAYSYFRLIRAQKEGAASLFQPVSGKLRGNIYRTNSDEEVQGLFWAAGATSSTVYIDRDDLPNFIGPPPRMIIECDVLKNSTPTKPVFWK
jgi:hypothetical protein